VNLYALMAGVALSALGLVTAACGGGSGSTQARATSTTNPIGATSDRATAQAINLTAADLPGWQQSPNQSSSSQQAVNSRLAACTGAPNPGQIDVVEVKSPSFDQAQTDISSDVTMVRSRADGLADLRALKGPKLNGCARQILIPSLSTQLPPGSTVASVDIGSFIPPGDPPDSFGLRTSATVSAPQQGTVTIVNDTIGFLAGRAEVGLDVTQIGGATPSQATEQRLLAILVTRSPTTVT
jgi:hypothetical protein